VLNHLLCRRFGTEKLPEPASAETTPVNYAPSTSLTEVARCSGTVAYWSWRWATPAAISVSPEHPWRSLETVIPGTLQIVGSDLGKRLKTHPAYIPRLATNGHSGQHLAAYLRNAEEAPEGL
jgi:hypothetical protein